MSALVSINLITLSSLKVTVHLYSVLKADLFFFLNQESSSLKSSLCCHLCRLTAVCEEGQHASSVAQNLA